jgi:hypothetical protein
LRVQNVATPLWGKCEDETHTPKSGNLESSGTPTTSELNSRGYNTSPWGVLYTVGKALKCKCRKWPRMSHLKICNTIYGRKKGQESNWQFDSRPQKVGNWPDPGVCRWSATHCCKALEESYKISLDSSQSEVWAGSYKLPKSRESKPGQFRDSSLGVPKIKAIWMRVPQSNAENTLWGKVVVRAVVSLVSPCCPWLVPTPRMFSKVN